MAFEHQPGMAIECLSVSKLMFIACSKIIAACAYFDVDLMSFALFLIQCFILLYI